MSLPKSTEAPVPRAVSGNRKLTGRGRGVLGLAALVALVLCGTALWWTRRAPPAVATASTTAEKPLRTSRSRLALRNSFPKVPRVVSAPGTETESPADRARHEIDELFALLRQSRLYSERTAELAVGSIRPRFVAWAKRIYDTTPDLLQPLAQEVEGRLCGPLPGTPELILLAKLGLLLPQLTSQRGFDCVFSRHQREDIVTWSLLDSWRHSGLDISPTLEAIQKRATDPRTHRRFMTADQELELRSRRVHAENRN